MTRTTTHLLSWLWSGLALTIAGIFALCLGLATKISFLVIPAAVCGIIFTIVAFLFPYLGLVAVVFAMPFEFLSQIGSEGSLTAGKIMLVLVILLWMAHAVIARKPQMLTAMVGHRIMVLGIFFIVCTLPSFINAQTIGASYYYFFRKMLPCFFLASMIVDLVKTTDRLVFLCKIYLAVAVLICSFGIYELATGKSILGLFGFDYNLIAGSAMGGLETTKTEDLSTGTSETAWVRIMSTFLDPGLFAGFMVLTAGLAIGLWPYFSRPWRILMVFFLFLCCWNMYFTGSRSALLSLLAFLVLFLLASRIPFRIPLAILGLAAGVAGMAVLGQIDPAFRAGFSLDAFRSDPRYGFWSNGLVMIKAHPVLGIGLFNVLDSYSVYSAHVAAAGQKPMFMHNTALQVIAECGIVGFIPFCLFMGVLFIDCARMAIRASDRNLAWFCRWQLVALVSFMPLFLMQNFLVFEYLWITIGLVAAANLIDRKQKGNLSHENLPD